MLLIELDGPREEVEAQAAPHRAHLPRARGALEIRVAQDEAERALALEGAQGGGGRGRPPDARLAASGRGGAAVEAPARSCARCSPSRARHGLRIANVFHAGDGNLHPMILYDDRVPDELERAKQANEELLAGVHRASAAA